MDHLPTIDALQRPAGLPAPGLVRAHALACDPVRWVRQATVLGVCLATCTAIVTHCGGSGGEPAGTTPARAGDHRRLLALMGAERPFEPRMVGGFSHGRCAPEPAGSNRLLPAASCGGEAGLAAATVRRLARAEPGYATTSDLHTKGVWRLLWADGPGAASRAVHDLRAAVAEDAAPVVLSDLAAALIIEARMSQDPYLLVEALDWAERSLEAVPEMPEGLFNRALILEDLGLDREARDGWRRYLDRDASSAWAGEARLKLQHHQTTLDVQPHLDRLAGGDPAAAAPAAAMDSARVRELALQDLFAKWAAAVERGDLAAGGRMLDTLRVVGKELLAVTGDHLVADAVAAIDRFEARPGLSRSTLPEAHRLFTEGRALMARSRYGEAALLLSSAQEGFRRGACPLDGWAELWLAACDSSTNQWHRTLERVAAIQEREDLSAYPALDARSRWARGLIELRTGDYESSLSSFLSASELFQAMGEGALVGSTTALSAESYRELGQRREAWAQRIRALRLLDSSSGRAFHNLMLDAGDALSDAGLFRAGAALQGFGLQRARREGSRSRAVESLLWRSRTWSAAGRSTEAGRDLELAWREVGEIEDPELRRRMEMHLHESTGIHLLSSDPAEARDRLTSVLGFHQEVGFTLGTASALYERARASLALGDMGEAKADLERAAQVFERRHLVPLDQLFRRESFERGQEIFEALIALHLDSGDHWGALAYVERARMAAVGQVIEADRRLSGHGEPSPVPATEEDLLRWAQEQAAGTVHLAYAVLPDQLAIWRIWDGQVETWRHTLPRADLRSAVTNLEATLRDGVSPEDFRGAASRMYRLLLADALEGVPPLSLLVIVPDRVLSRVPFAALLDPASGRHLIEDHPVTSAMSLVRSPGRRGSPAVFPAVVGQGTALIAGNPLALTQSALPQAEGEAREVASAYPDARLLLGEDVQRTNLRTLLPASAYFHYAGHGVDDPQGLWGSYLVLSPSAENPDGRYPARDVLDLDLSGLHLAVLAACSTAAGREHRAAPVSGLTLAFLEAGTATVLSTLWAVDDGANRALLRSFHRQIAAGSLPAEALRGAILEDLVSYPGGVHAWAPLVLYSNHN